MVWYRSPARLWLIIGLLVAALGWQLLDGLEEPTPRDRTQSAGDVGEPEIPGSYVPPRGNKDGVRVMVRRFMEARLRGHGALRFVAPEARDEFGRGGGLAPIYPRPPLKEFEIAFVDGPLSGPSYEVGVELVFARGSYGDTLFVSFTKDRYVVTGGRPGLTGP